MGNEAERIITEHAKPKLTVDEQIAHLKAKGARNAYAHSTCVLNALRVSGKGMKIPTEVVEELAEVGISKTSRKLKMKKIVLHQIVIVIYTYRRFVNNQTFKEEAAQELGGLKERLNRHGAYYEKNDSVRSAFQFLEKAFDIL